MPNVNQPTLQITHEPCNHMVLQRGGTMVFCGICLSTGPVRGVIRRGAQVMRRLQKNGGQGAGLIGDQGEVVA